MRIIYSRSPNQALNEGLYHLHFFGTTEPSRNGDVIVSKEPVVTIHTDPTARVMGGNTRDANPFFHLAEALWMLDGRNDLALPQLFVKDFGQYSDDGETLHGAYGQRWREGFGFDQLDVIANELKTNPTSRRCVLQMWDANPLITIGLTKTRGFDDLNLAMNGGKDVPCNTQIYFDTLGGKLNMTVLCRSNDVLFGAYGANIVHFSILLEYMAARTELPIGDMRQWHNNYHVYTNKLVKEKFCSYADSVIQEDLYQEVGSQGIRGQLKPKLYPPHRVPLFVDGESWNSWHVDNGMFLDAMVSGEPQPEYASAFFNNVATPMFSAWRKLKQGFHADALASARAIEADDWRTASATWIQKRIK
jgi:thymidylate synthase